MASKSAAVGLLGLALTMMGAEAQAQERQQMAQNPKQGVSGLGSDTGSVPPEWDAQIAKAFFLDTGSGTLRTEAEVRANWAQLSPSQHEAVRDYCAQAPQGAEDDGGMREPNVTRGSLIRLCSWIKRF
ncbi:hypothetical protein [Neoaquamicrobium sediminum]|uniref:hypothetical protein n=1 Tax=Neoaquamicrobium sediminum TaxID=1849104 RepID=UPI00403597C4